MTTLVATGLETGDLSLADRVTGAAGVQLISNDQPGPWSLWAAFIEGYTTWGNAARLGFDTGLKTEIVFGCHAKFDRNNSGFEIWDSQGNVQCIIAVSGTGIVEVWRGIFNALVASSTKQAKEDVWYWVSGRILMGDAGDIDIWIGDEEFINATGDIQASGNANLAQFVAYGGAGPGAGVKIDDLWIIERTGPHASADVHLEEIGISGHRPMDDGDTTQLVPSPGSQQRFYFPSTSGTALLPTSVTPDSLWDRGATSRHVSHLSPKKLGTAMATKSYSSSTAAWNANDDLLVAQFISRPMAAQTISGTVKGYIRAQQTSDRDLRGQIVLRVVSKDGGTVRGILYAGDAGSLASEWATSLTNRKITPNAPLTLSSVVALEGDRLVVEIGARAHLASSGGSQFANLRMGDTGTTDLPENETETNDYVPWIEFSSAIQFLNWTNVDEIGYDDEATYNYENTVNDQDLYQMEDMPAEFPDVKTVVVRARTRLVEPGPGKLALPIKSGVTTHDGSDIPISPAWTWVQRAIDDVDPTDSNPWTRAKVNALQAGAKIR